MAGFGVVWAAIAIIIVTPLLGGLFTKIAIDFSENQFKIRRKERELVSIAKKNTIHSSSRTISTMASEEEEFTIRSQQSMASERKNKNHRIRLKLQEFKDELIKLNRELDE